MATKFVLKIKLFQIVLFQIQVFNPLYFDGFSHTDKYNKDEIVH